MSKYELPDKLTVDWLLSNVDLQFKEYIPSAVAFEFFSFIRLALGEEPENANPLAHYFLIDTIFQQDNVAYYYEERGIDYQELKSRTAIMCTREFSKSTLIGTYLPLFMAWKGEIPGYGKVNYGIYVGDSMRNNVKTTMNTIEVVFLESLWLMDQFESYRFTDEVMELVRHPRTKQEIATYNKYTEMGKKKDQIPGRRKRAFSLKGVGAQTGTRGTRSGLQRPQFVIFDDLIASEADSNSDAVLANIETTIDSDVLKALHGSGSFAMIIGTPYNKRDPVYRRLESGSWVPVVFPICKDIRLDMPKEEFVGVWEDRHSYKNVMKRYKDDVREDKLRSFNQELMLRISSEEDRLIPDSYINWFKRSDIINNGQEYNWYISTDFTTSGKKGNDFSGMAVWAVNSNDDYMLVDLSLKKLELAEQYQELFRLVNRYKRFNGNIEVGIETDGQQKIHIYAIKQLMAKKNEYFTIGKQKGSTNEGISSGGIKKFERFRGSAVPLFQNGKIWFAEDLKSGADMQELLTELQYTTYQGFGSGHDDGCSSGDTLVMTVDGQVPMRNMENISAVTSWSGSDSAEGKVSNFIITGVEQTYTVTTEDGSEMYLTGNHPVLTTEGYIRVDALTTSDKIIKVQQCKKKDMGSNGQRNLVDTTSRQQQSMANDYGYIEKYIKEKWEQYLISLKYTISMKIKTITERVILGYYQAVHTSMSIEKRIAEEANQGCSSLTILSCKNLQSEQEEVSIQESENFVNYVKGISRKYASTAKRVLYSKILIEMIQSTARLHAGISGEIRKRTQTISLWVLQSVLYVTKSSHSLQEIKCAVEKSVQKCLQRESVRTNGRVGNALSVERVLTLSGVVRKNTVETDSVRIVNIVPRKIEVVYNFTVEDYHNYTLGDGLVTHNCDLITQIGLMQTYSPSAVAQEKHPKDVMWWENIEEESNNGLNSYIV